MRAVAPLATAARPLIATSTAAPGLPALQTTALAHGARLINSGTMGAASTSSGTTSFAVPLITQRRRGANICHQRLEYPNERITDYYRDYCKTMAIIQQFSSPNSRLLGSSAMRAVAPLATAARPLIATSTAAPGLPALQTTALAHGARLINSGTMGAASTSSGTTSFAVPLITQRRRGANICHQRLEYPNERTADYYRDYCKTMTIIQQFSSPNTPKHNGLSKRDGCTIMDVARCMLNGAALPKSLRGKMAATMVFLLNRPPSKTIGGDTSYNSIVRQTRRPVLPVNC